MPEGPPGPSFFERLCKRLVILLLGSMAVAGVIHLYRNNQLPLLQQPIPGFDHPLLSTPVPEAPAEPAPPSPPSASRPSPSASATSSTTAPSFPPTAGSGASPAPAAVWTRQDLADMSLEAPAVLKTMLTPTGMFTAGQMKQILQVFQWEGKTADHLAIEALFFRIDGRHTLSLEDGVKGAIQKISQLAGDPNPAYRRNDIFVNGVPGRSISYARAINGQTLHVEALCLQNVRDGMAVVVAFQGEEHSRDAQRILNSLQIRR